MVKRSGEWRVTSDDGALAAKKSEGARAGVSVVLKAAHLRFADFFEDEVLRATAARISALNAFASICSPS